MFATTENNTIQCRFRAIAIACLAITTLPACQSINYKQVAYEALRNEDCRRNELDSFCERSYAQEYHEYERMRKEILRDTAAIGSIPPWRIKKTSWSES